MMIMMIPDKPPQEAVVYPREGVETGLEEDEDDDDNDDDDDDHHTWR